MESDHRYFSRRADEERRRAKFAVTAEARRRHDELADSFAAKAAQGVRLQMIARLRAQ